jgi:voltage-gated potassium channel Kch
VDPSPVADTPLASSPYELFIVALSLLSLFNIGLLILPLDDDTKGIIMVLDGIMCIVFLGDFTQRLLRAKSKRQYFFRHLGWLDLLGSLPAPGLRLFRIGRVVHLLRDLHRKGGRRMVREISKGRAEAALLLVLFLVFVNLEFATMAVLAFEEHAPGATITSAGDALWWGIVTMTTVGYGDFTPVSNGGRYVGAYLMIVGVGLFGVIAAFVSNFFLSPRAHKTGSAPQDIDAMRTLLDQNDALADELRARLNHLEASMRSSPKS